MSDNNSTIIETITASLAPAETLRQSILKKVFEGKLISMVKKLPINNDNDFKRFSSKTT